MDKARKEQLIPVCIYSAHPLAAKELIMALATGFRVELWKDAESTYVPLSRVYVIDANAPHEPLLELLQGLFVKRPGAQVILVAEEFLEAEAFPLLQLGVRGLVNLSELQESLPRAVRNVAGGGYWVPRTLLSKFVDFILADSAGKKSIGSKVRLSRREQDVVACVLDNYSNKDIAKKLNISERTAKFHVSNLLAKYGVGRRADLILLWYQHDAARFPSIPSLPAKRTLVETSH